jgi:rSAM/selenodomain-associated transferase 1
MRRIREAQTARASRSSAAPFARHLVIMAKEPVAGRVKSRLARDIGIVEATRFYRQTLRAVVQRLGADPRWQTVLAVAPDRAVVSRALPGRSARIGQGQGDLGARMDRLMRRSERGPVVIVGTDIPAIRPADIWAAFRRLAGADAVVGPVPDGGYWLVGLKRTPRVPRAFDRVRWSSPHALADTCECLRHHHVVRTQTLADVDGEAEFADVKSWFGRRVLPAEFRHGPGARRRD